MKPLHAGCVALSALLLQAGMARAQSSLDALEDELKEVKQQHEDATAQNLANFFGQVDQAMADPGAAVTLYQQAGGTLPPPTPVTTVHDTESASERDARLAQDQANATGLGNMLQVHCGLLHYAALFVTNPDQKDLPDQFNAWLQKVAQVYPSLGNLPASGGGAGGPGGGDSNGEKHHHREAGAGGPGGGGQGFSLNDLKAKTMRDSLIAKYLGFKSWGDKEPGGWAVRDIPNLFKAKILDPLRATPSQATLDAWNVYIAMASADEPDNDKWTNTEYPPLQFERACDDFAITPGTDKIENLVQIIHANPTHPDADEWIKRTKQMLDDYSAKHGGRPAPSAIAAPPPPASGTNPNVVVTTIQQGDAQIITTRTNATANPAPPQ
jgi:hypothetical protein